VAVKVHRIRAKPLFCWILEVISKIALAQTAQPWLVVTRSFIRSKELDASFYLEARRCSVDVARDTESENPERHRHDNCHSAIFLHVFGPSAYTYSTLVMVSVISFLYQSSARHMAVFNEI
jgi:hypothetical protein